MNVFLYQEPDKHRGKEKPKLKIKVSTDSIIRITKTTTCGIDLHIMKGDLSEVIGGLILRH